MSSNLFAIEGRLGTTDYWVIKMKASEVVNNIRIPKEVKGWGELTLEERYQRDINIARVKKDIAPYIAESEDRFFGPLLVAVQNSEKMSFEPIEKIIRDLPNAYKASIKGAGFLTFSGSEVMLPIDGQHRLKALKYAIDGVDDQGKELSFKGNEELGKEDIVIILFKFVPDSARRIFNKVNQYAKPTTRGQNLITDDDDPYAVITRKVVNDVLGGGSLVSQSNTLNEKSPEFSTLPVLYSCVKSIIDAQYPLLDSKSSNHEKSITEKFAAENLRFLFEKINHFSTMLHDREKTGNEKRIEMRKTSLLGKPAPQLCLVRAFMSIISPEENSPLPPKKEEVVKKLNDIDWSLEGEHWQKILMNGKRILATSQAINLSTDFIIYYAGYASEELKNSLLERYKNLHTDERAAKITKLPVMRN